VAFVTNGLPLSRRSVLFRVAAEPSLLLTSGPRALLLQVAHPSVAAGVAQHSDYQSRPWVRLFRTLAVVTALTFADPARSQRAANQLRRRHAEIEGTTENGSPYQALDPDLLLWVWATLGDCMVRSHERFVGALTEIEREELYSEWKLVAYGCGVPTGACPDTWTDFNNYFRDMVNGELLPTEVACSVARYVRRPPVPFPFNVLSGEIMHILTGGQLPAALRRDLGFDWNPVRELAFEATAAASRLAGRVIPGRIRRAPVTVATTAPVLSSFRSRRPGPPESLQPFAPSARKPVHYLS
jgi:uncharacterized protein (DUF2236 family)